MTVADIMRALDAAYPPRLAEPWDTGIGLTCGDPAAIVERVLLAVDVDRVTVEQARSAGAGMLVTHHPLLFRPVQTVAAATDKGALVHALIRSGIAHFAAHTNADRAIGGVNDALADALGLRETRPLVPAASPDLDTLVTFVPTAAAEELIGALAAAGAGRVGRYAEAAFVSGGQGRFRPLDGAHPAIGEVGAPQRVDETRIEMALPRRVRAAVVAALRSAHPYEEPAFSITENHAGARAVEGLGRVGTLDDTITLRDFVDVVAAALPATTGGVTAAGDPRRPVTTVAVCGGAGGSELAAATAAGADVYVTSDLSHHTVAEHVADPSRPAIVRVAHFAGEWPWLARAADVIRAAADGSVAVTVSAECTDPWTVHVASVPTEGEPRRAQG